MANTVITVGDEALLRSIVDGSIEEFEDNELTSVGDHAFRGCSALEKVTMESVETIGKNAFVGCPLETIYFPSCYRFTSDPPFSGTCTFTVIDGTMFPALEESYSNAFNNGLSTVTAVNLPKWTGLNSNSVNATNHFRSMGNVETIVLPNCAHFGGYECASDAKLETVCLGGQSEYSGTKYIRTGAFNACTNLKKLILYSDTAWTLDNTSAFTNSPFASGKSGGTLYVPQSLISTYQSATNWSTILGYANNSILAIEGSEYEHYYCDGTPVGISSNGLIAHYNVGSASDWDAETNKIASRIDTDLEAWNVNNIYSDAILAPPTLFYDGYAKTGLLIKFGQAMSEFSDTDTVTLEFVCATNSTSGFDTRVKYFGQSSGSQTSGYLNVNFRVFRHFIIEFSKTGTNIYIDGVLKNSSADDRTGRNTFLIPYASNSGNTYIGQVNVWNRALTAEERTQHYQHYVANYHVGETAYDSSGNFVAGT